MRIVTDLNTQLIGGASAYLLDQLMNWFKTEDDIRIWGGPEFRYPYTRASFVSDAQLENLLTVCLLDDAGQLEAFGQCYNRLDCCHLARLAIAPNLRGRGLVVPLVNALANEAKGEFCFSELSLFVLESNKGARHAYQKQGFKYLDYPAHRPDAYASPDILYMRKAL